MTNKKLSDLKNIGKTVASRLHEIGIKNESQLKELGAAKAYKWLSEQNSGKHLPVCYYLYSLEGAIRDKHWDSLTDNPERDNPPKKNVINPVLESFHHRNQVTKTAGLAVSRPELQSILLTVLPQ